MLESLCERAKRSVKCKTSDVENEGETVETGIRACWETTKLNWMGVSVGLGLLRSGNSLGVVSER